MRTKLAFNRQAMMHNPLSLWSWHGRTNRARFIGATYAFFFIVYLFAPLTLPRFWLEAGRLNVFSISAIIVTIACAWLMCVAPAIRRLHDRNKSGWWLFAYYILPWTFFPMIADRIGSEAARNMFMVATLPLAIWAFVDMWCLKGTTGDNRFGPDPVAYKSAQAATQPAA